MTNNEYINSLSENKREDATQELFELCDAMDMDYDIALSMSTDDFEKEILEWERFINLQYYD